MVRGVASARLASAGTWLGTFVLLAACGDARHGSKNSSSSNSTASGGSASDGSGGSSSSGGTSSGPGGASASAGTGGTENVEAGGSGGREASGGTAGSGGSLATGGSADVGGGAGEAGTGGSDGSGGDGGAGGSGGNGGSGGSDPCEGVSECETAGTTCDGDTLVTCAADDNGCLLEERTDCFPQPCDDAETAACGSHGDSCADPLVVTTPVVISGDDFGTDYTASFTLTGSNCAGYGSGRDMVLEVDLDAGQTVAVSQWGDVQTALNIASACDASAQCFVSTDGLYGNEGTGIHYHATDATTVFLIVDLIGGGSIWDYNVTVDFPESLGVLAAGDPIPEVVATSDAPSREVRLIEFTEPVQLSGTLDAGGSPPSLYWWLVDAEGNTVANFEAYGDDSFGPFSVPAGEYRFVVSTVYPDNVTVQLSTN